MASIYSGVVDKYFISSLDPSLDKRAIDPIVYDMAQEDSFTDMLQIGDRKQPVTQNFFISWTNTKLFYQGQATSATNSGTTAVTVVLTLATSGIARLGTTAYLKDGTSGIVSSVSTASGIDTIIIKTDNGVLTVAANDFIGFGGIVAGERSIAPTNQGFGYTKYSNKVQIFKEVSEITDVQEAGKLEATIAGNDTFIFKDHIDKLKLMKGSMNFEFLMSNISTTNFQDASPALLDPNSSAAGGGKGVQRSRGLYQYISTYGTDVSAIGSGTSSSPVPNGSVALADMDNVCDALIAARAPKKQIGLCGSSVKRGVDKLFKNLPSSGVNSVRMVVSGRELDLEVDQVTYGGFDFSFSPMGIMDHTLVSGTVVGKSLLFVPYDFKVPVYANGTTSEQPAIGMRYYQNKMKFGNEIIGETYTGALAPIGQNEVSEWRTIWQATAALEFKSPSFGLALKVNA